LFVAVLALVVAGGALWASYAAVAPPSDPAIKQIKETISSLQQPVNGIQSDQKKLAAQLNDIQQKASAQQGEQKLLSDQLAALSARVNSLQSARAERPAAAQPSARRRTKR
jgi:septal ring factor EnvC (AmiA/AmiB activator)